MPNFMSYIEILQRLDITIIRVGNVKENGFSHRRNIQFPPPPPADNIVTSTWNFFIINISLYFAHSPKIKG